MEYENALVNLEQIIATTKRLILWKVTIYSSVKNRNYYSKKLMSIRKESINLVHSYLAKRSFFCLFGQCHDAMTFTVQNTIHPKKIVGILLRLVYANR